MRTTKLFAIAALTALTLEAVPADAGCGCRKSPPPPAPVRPSVTYAGMPVTLFSSAFVDGAEYQVTFTSAAGATATTTGTVASRRDLSSGQVVPQLTVSLPVLPLGPAAITATAANANAPVVSIADAGFTVAASPIEIPAEYADMWQYPGAQAAVGRDGTVYLALDMSGMTKPMVFEAEALGYPLRFGADDVLFYNTQGFLMQALVTGTATPVPGMFVIPAVDMFDASDRVRYSRHEFATYFLQHEERQSHSLASDPNWHADGTPHIDHDHLILAIRGTMRDGSTPVAGATPAFDLVISTHSLFHDGVVGRQKIKMENNAATDSYDSETGIVGAAGDLFTNGEAELKGLTRVNGDVVAGTFKIDNGVRVFGDRTVRPMAITFMDVEVPEGTIDLGRIELKNRTTTIVGPGSFRSSKIKLEAGGRIIVDNSAGPVTLYVTGEIEVMDSGSVQLVDPRPETFAIYGTSDKDVKLKGTSHLLSVLYAPYSKVVVEGGLQLSGSIVGRELELKDSIRIHYDSTLRGAPAAQ